MWLLTLANVIKDGKEKFVPWEFVLLVKMGYALLLKFANASMDGKEQTVRNQLATLHV